MPQQKSMPKAANNQELHVILLADSLPQLEWQQSTRRQSKAQIGFQQAVFDTASRHGQSWFLFMGFTAADVNLTPSLAFWHNFSRLFVNQLRLLPDLEENRHTLQLELEADEIEALLTTLPAMVGAEYVSASLINDLWQHLHALFQHEIAHYSGTVAEFIHHFAPDCQLLGRIYFHLVENRDSDTPFAFLATYSTRLDEEGASRHLPLKYALQEYRDDEDKLLDLLATVHKAARDSAFLSELLETNDLFHPLAWDAAAAHTFLRETHIYEEAGILCRIPDWWQGKKSRVGLRLSLGDKKPAMIGMQALLDFSPSLVIGEEEISLEEAHRLLAQTEGLAFIKNKWVALDHEKLQQTLAAYEAAKKVTSANGLSLAEAMRLQLQPQTLLAGHEDIDISLDNGRWLRKLFSTMRQPARLEEITPEKGFTARLRPYQQLGLRWLNHLHELGFGSCLADDMGLGKTVQLLAFLHHLGQQGRADRPSLLIIPASLLANWAAEIKRFCPTMRIFIAHPDFHKPRRVTTPTADKLARLDLLITTYALAQRYTWLAEQQWQCLILDEAQAIKNPATKQTRAVKALAARQRIIMTGTPVENRLADLWSLFDFINPGLLGSPTEFKKFSKGLAEHPDGYGRLRRMIAPFILRRLKSDKTIIADLPDKVELKAWTALSKKQLLLYEQVVEGIKASLQQADGMQRRGLILAALTKFKQICNHPDQHLGTGSFKEKESGKFIRLAEICRTIYEKRERVLIFTQFKEMTEPLARFLADIFARPGLVLHGSVPVGKRKKIISQFQGDEYIPFMVLSLKAGGVGLNLTKANHVVHFDRWWNPAIENQATDRAFRIGQKKKVMVHKFISKGTIEEKIDDMLEQKAALAADVVANSGETWLTEMDNKQLTELFTLER